MFHITDCHTIKSYMAVPKSVKSLYPEPKGEGILLPCADRKGRVLSDDIISSAPNERPASQLFWRRHPELVPFRNTTSWTVDINGNC